MKNFLIATKSQLFTCLLAAMAGYMFFATSAQAGGVTFTDTEFANWSSPIELLDETTNDSFAISASTEGAGGNPNAYRRFEQNLNEAGPGTINVRSGHIFQSGNFNPGGFGSEVFSSLDFSFDGVSFNSTAGAMGFGLLLEQSGNYFGFAVDQVLNNVGFQNRSGSGLTAADFFAFGGGALDLSATGAIVSFGFFGANGTFGTPSINTGGIDNFNISFTTVNPVPLPAAMWMFLTALGSIGIFGWRRRRAAA